MDEPTSKPRKQRWAWAILFGIVLLDTWGYLCSRYLLGAGPVLLWLGGVSIVVGLSVWAVTE